MNKAMLLRAALGSVSVLAFANPALAQDEPSTSGQAQSGTTEAAATEDDSEGIDPGHRPAAGSAAPGRADLGVGVQRRAARGAADRQCAGPPADPAQHHLHQDQLHLVELHHPRRRRPLRRLLVRPGDRHPRQRHAADRHPAVRNRIFRPRTGRGAARAAGHPVRPQRDLRRGQLHHRPARSVRLPRQRQRRIWQFRQHKAARHGQRAARQHHRRAARRLLSQPRRLHRKTCSTTADIDDRDLYALRGTIRIEPSDSTTFDLFGYYFHERDNRSRIQKQMCNRDPTGVLGCAPDSLEFETVNGNSTLAALLTSREFLRINNAGADQFRPGQHLRRRRVLRRHRQPRRPAHRQRRLPADLFRRGISSDGPARAGHRREFRPRRHRRLCLPAGRFPHRLQPRRRQFARQQSRPADACRHRGGARRALPRRRQSLRAGPRRPDPERPGRRRLHVGDQPQLYRHLWRIRQPLHRRLDRL